MKKLILTCLAATVFFASCNQGDKNSEGNTTEMDGSSVHFTENAESGRKEVGI
jgi:protein involved in sex pheromone biosynthesis